MHVTVRANLELLEEVPALDRYHAEGVGLFRSEFLYLKAAPAVPGVEEQRAAYERLLEAARPHPVVVRTYDLGGEKGIGPVHGENPALGLRGLRYCLAHPELFDAQLEALCLASRKGELRILLPMVTSLSEVRAARRHIARAAERTGLPRPPSTGVMIEVPSAALLAAELAPEADFFSIGTNDLAQYGLAVDRANPDVAALYQPLHPAILRMIRMVASAGRANERPVAVCGEMASDPLGITFLLGVGLTELSVTPVAIGAVKEQVGQMDVARAAVLAEKALSSAGRGGGGAVASREVVRRVPKPWGHEIVFAENERYAGKILHIEPGHKLSLQYHERKDETLYVLSGEVYLLVEVDGVLTESRLRPGDSYRIRPGVRHRMRAETGCDLVEVSSPELDDVVRLEDDYGREGTTAP